MPDIDRKHRIQQYYRRLNKSARTQLLDAYCYEFNLSRPSFYKTLRNNNRLWADQAVFFAFAFGVTVESLYRRPRTVSQDKLLNPRFMKKYRRVAAAAGGASHQEGTMFMHPLHPVLCQD